MIGRKKEIQILRNALQDDRSGFIAVYGRRRVGKTCLIRETCADRFTFSHAGLFGGNLNEQLYEFSASLKSCGYYYDEEPHSWLEAFEGLKDLIRQSGEKKKVIFLDELSWMDTPKSGLIMALENFWNGFASARKDVLLIVCASATSWMLSQVIHNKGGLYNRLTSRIHLEPFSLSECEEYARSAGLALTRGQILQCYMIFGGIPYYWELLQKGYSLPQNIDHILFEKDAPLRDEYRYLFSAVFRKPDIYIRIIEALGTKKVGMTREEIIASTGLNNSGDLSRRLEELESCGFIRCYHAFSRKNHAIYQLMDFYTLFYYKFLKDQPTDAHFWSNQINTPAVNSWMGLAFERVCLDHVGRIKHKLGISGVLTEVNSWYCKADPDKGIFGSQIDLLIVRRDQVINLCEMKYTDSEFPMTEETVRSLHRKMHDLVTVTGTKYAIHPTMIAPYGILDNAYAGNIQSVITMDDLFG